MAVWSMGRSVYTQGTRRQFGSTDALCWSSRPRLALGDLKSASLKKKSLIARAIFFLTSV